MANKLVALLVKLNEDRETLNMYYCECGKYMFNVSKMAHDFLLKDKALRLDCKDWMLYTIFELKDFYHYRLWEETMNVGGCYTEITEDMCQVLTPNELLAESLKPEGEQ